MTNKIANKSIILTVLAAALIMVLNADVWAQRTRGQGQTRQRGVARDRRGTTQGATQTTTKAQEAAQQIQQAAQDLDTTLVTILEMVNQQQQPAAQDLDRAKAVVTAAKRHAKKFLDPMKCELYMLDAWNKYFDKDFKSAALSATMAYKADQTNNDAHSTQTAMAIFANRKPLVIAPPRQSPTSRSTATGTSSQYGRRAPTNTRTRTPRTQNNPAATSINVNASSGNILQFDPTAVDIKMIGKTVNPMKVSCVNSTSMEYNPAQTNLCIMFWQIESKSQPGEPNDASTRPTRTNQSNPYDRQPQRGGNRGDYGRGDYGRGDYGRGDYGRGDYGRDAYAPAGRGYGIPNQQNGDPLTSQMDAYGKIFQTRVINPQVKFLAINTNPLTDTPAVIEKMFQNPWPWANVMAANPASGASQFADITATTPILAIADRTGKIKYAGPAEGFLAPMIIDHFTGQPAPAPTATPTLITNPVKPTPTRPTTTQPQTNLNIPNQDSGEITADDYQAGKLLEYAKMFVQLGRKPKLTSKKGVETCREIIKKYPQSTYAQEARMLLRKVPEYERKRYKITDAEMGL